MAWGLLTFYLLQMRYHFWTRPWVNIWYAQNLFTTNKYFKCYAKSRR